LEALVDLPLKNIYIATDMEKKLPVKIERSTFDSVLDYLGWLILIFLWVMTVYSYATLNTTIPTHFNASGRADAFGNKHTLFILPVLGTIIFTGLTILNRYPWTYNYLNYSKENAAEQYSYASKMIRSLKTAIILLFALVSLFSYLTAIGKTDGLGTWFLPFLLVVILIPQSYYIIKSLRLVK
jgi:uncharacterized membrane protein